MSTIWGLVPDKTCSDNLSLSNDFMNYSFDILSYINQFLHWVTLDRLLRQKQVSTNCQHTKPSTEYNDYYTDETK